LHYRFYLSFDITTNSGNKIIFAHLWKTADCPSLSYASAPTAAGNLAGLTAYYGFWIDWNGNGNFADDVDFSGDVKQLHLARRTEFNYRPADGKYIASDKH